MKLKDIASWTPEQITQAEWRTVGNALKQAQQYLEADGCRHSWLDAPVEICRLRSKP
jgi:hypothetical protein